jgi:hypothetical protein
MHRGIKNLQYLFKGNKNTQRKKKDSGKWWQAEP